MPSAETWMELEIIILSEVSQRQISYDITNIWSLKMQMNLFIKQTHRHREQTYGYKRGKGKEE